MTCRGLSKLGFKHFVVMIITVYVVYLAVILIWRIASDSPNLSHAILKVIIILKLNQSLYIYARSSSAKAYYTHT